MALRNLVQGMSGEDVRALQNGLNEYFNGRRTPIDTTGYFGRNTRAGVDALQQENPGTGRPDGSPDGIVGRATRRKLFPLAVVTTSVVGFRLRRPERPRPRLLPPNLGPGPLRVPGTPQPGLTLNPQPLRVDWSTLMQPARINFTPQRFPGLRNPLTTPPVLLAPRPVPDRPTGLLRLGSVHHFELSPGTQMVLQNPSETSFSLGIQGVAVIGDENTAHQEFAMGTQLASPNVDGSGDWSISWYAQITDVDRFGALGQFHYWQPYAQVGLQGPVITGSVFPVNLGFDVNRFLTVSVAGGVAFKYDTQTGSVSAEMQGTAGLILKFDMTPPSR
jgi:hypothetical protein